MRFAYFTRAQPDPGRKPERHAAPAPAPAIKVLADPYAAWCDVRHWFRSGDILAVPGHGQVMVCSVESAGCTCLDQDNTERLIPWSALERADLV